MDPRTPQNLTCIRPRVIARSNLRPHNAPSALVPRAAKGKESREEENCSVSGCEFPTSDQSLREVGLPSGRMSAETGAADDLPLHPRVRSPIMKNPHAATRFQAVLPARPRATLVPVVKSISADLLTPVSAFLAIAEKEPYAFLAGIDRAGRADRALHLSWELRPYMRVKERARKGRDRARAPARNG